MLNQIGSHGLRVSKCLPELHGGKRGDQALLGAQAATSEEGWGLPWRFSVIQRSPTS